ncbi:subtilisin-like protease [Phtheirospermum japonicum]|uniref:Subtilisin-like protease n=1 Tax=Phtheirospermum japonicum TaxID=374723 RepID=A0A830CC82_9LAMI|nr:subtilisin-like protease [Phtheirospermum japonicum]
MDKSAKPQEFSDHKQWYSSMIKSILTSTTTTTKTAFHGVAAQLTEDEARKLQQQNGVMATFPETLYQLHTTRSPLFLGLERINEQEEFKSPRDQDGHGTHTAATVAGVPVRGANLLGYAYGTARGMAPGARIAAYKVCWTGGCFSSDILSAIDQAVSDGVNVLSISLGGGVSSYYRDSLSIGAFAAMEMGVFVSCSAGNGGPDPISLTNVSPWVATVGASTMDRAFPATIKLGTGKYMTGTSLYKGKRNLSTNRLYALVYRGSNNSNNLTPSSMCLEGTLDRHSVSGKIVICDRGISPRVQKGQVVKDAGGVGMILTNTAANGEELVADCHLLPAVAVGETTGKFIKHYGGIAALIKSRHPDWSPAAIKSALMTTAYVHDNTHNPLKDASKATLSTPYDHGAGHINPMKALDPGLIYDISAQDYFEFLCAQGLTTSELVVFSKISNRTCRHVLANTGDLNYPAISAIFSENANASTVLTLHRTVTNVGSPVSSYHVVISPFKGASVRVEPEKLEFTAERKKMTYKITFAGTLQQAAPEFGSIIWKDGVHKVRSPVVITWLPPL